MPKVYESEDTVVYRNENGDTWIKNTHTDERKYIPNESIESVMLEENDIKLKGISFVSGWGTYYHLTFKHTKKTSFPLVFNSKLYGKKTLNFAKKAKYVFTKKGF